MRPRSKKTLYRGVLYRSKIEAKWAVFYDILGIQHKYEPFWSDVDSKRGCIKYKPDFEIFIPRDNHTYYIEIKDSKPPEEAITKACGWAREYGDVVIFFDLRPPKPISQSGWLFEWNDISDQVLKQINIWWCECPKCGYLGIRQYGELPCKCYPDPESTGALDWDEVFGTDYSLSSTRTPRLLSAYKNAQNYEF
ncbi:MAG: hypothetical protein NTV58_15025 [Deltaproteobacteria bacterium]|nr:hypothetical protein [Deltaproteobacteria bacterium]